MYSGGCCSIGLSLFSIVCLCSFFRLLSLPSCCCPLACFHCFAYHLAFFTCFVYCFGLFVHDVVYCFGLFAYGSSTLPAGKTKKSKPKLQTSPKKQATTIDKTMKNQARTVVNTMKNKTKRWKRQNDGKPSYNNRQNNENPSLNEAKTIDYALKNRTNIKDKPGKTSRTIDNTWKDKPAP